MNKIAQFSSLWPQIYQKLKSPPPGLNLGGFPRQASTNGKNQY